MPSHNVHSEIPSVSSAAPSVGVRRGPPVSFRPAHSAPGRRWSRRADERDPIREANHRPRRARSPSAHDRAHGPAPALAAETAAIHVAERLRRRPSDTRATGHYEVAGTGLHIWTDGRDEHGQGRRVRRRPTTPLADVGEPSLDYTTTSGASRRASSWSSTSTATARPTASWSASRRPTGRLVASTGRAVGKAGAPSRTAAPAAPDHGTLDEWRRCRPATRR